MMGGLTEDSIHQETVSYLYSLSVFSEDIHPDNGFVEIRVGGLYNLIV